jgi:pyruvate kinase
MRKGEVVIMSNKIVLHIDKKSCSNCEMHGCCQNEGNICNEWDISLDEFDNSVSKLSEEDQATVKFNLVDKCEIVEDIVDFSKYMNPPESE